MHAISEMDKNLCMCTFHIACALLMESVFVAELVNYLNGLKSSCTAQNAGHVLMSIILDCNDYAILLMNRTKSFEVVLNT
jgi:hypothetical protein